METTLVWQSLRRPLTKHGRRLGILALLVLVLLSESLSAASPHVVSLTLDQRGKLADDRETKLFGGPSRYLPTGLYKRADEPITITLHPHDQQTPPRVVISPPVLQDYTEADQDGTPLRVGTNVISGPQEGVIHLVNESYPTNTPPVVTISGAYPFTHYVLGQHTYADWKQMLEEFRHIPAIELVGSRVMITSSYAVAKDIDDPDALLHTLDEAVSIMDRVSGLDPEDPNPMHRPSRYRQHMREASWGYMYMYLNHTGYESNAMRNVLNAHNVRNDFMNFGWGPWHELGHTYQQSLWKWAAVGEVTVNIYSLNVEQAFVGNRRLQATDSYTDAFLYMNQPHRDFLQYDDLFAKLVMFWQLQLAFGPEFYPSLHRAYREMPVDARPASESEQIQTFVVMASTVAERNLAPFFETWGLRLTHDTRAAIAHLPELTGPIWRLTDTGYVLPPVYVQATEGYGTLGTITGAPLVEATPIRVVAPDLDVAHVRISLDGAVWFEGETLPDRLLLKPSALENGEHSLTVLITETSGKKHSYGTHFRVEHTRLLAPRRKAHQTTAERLSGVVDVHIEPVIPIDQLANVSVELTRVVTGLADAESPNNTIVVHSGTDLPRPIMLNTVVLNDGAYDLVIRSETMDGVVSQISERVVLDNWEELVDPILPPVSEWFGSWEQIKAVDRSTGWAYANDEPQRFSGDADRIIPTEPGDQYLTWNMEHLQHYRLVLYVQDWAMVESITVSVSDDGRNWTHLSPNKTTVGTEHTDPYVQLERWSQVILDGTVPHDLSANYLRVTIHSDDHAKGGIQLGEVQLRGLKDRRNRKWIH